MYIQLQNGCLESLECLFWLSRMRVLSRRAAVYSHHRAWRFQDACLSLVPGIGQLSSCCQSDTYKMMSRFLFISLLTVEFEYLICLLAFEVSSSVSCQFLSLDHFLLGVGILSWLTCRSSLVFQLLTPCQRQTANIFSHSVCCLLA